MGFLIAVKAIAFIVAMGSLLGCIVAGIAYLIQRANSYFAIGFIIGGGISALGLLGLFAAWVARALLH